ncbi:mitochondrial fission ELM1 family protein [Marinobacterium ramblicola]|uniref:mitochondrial fission ELM1 family protein n=1 Tax=Marinobacterium ramblicola TaxID=2849041 RepID=UPI001FE6AECF|nr:mitochondrial fission ELM1 family protein [Marinobacterium ramblicola]
MTQILIISDGKAGHRNQSLGLAEALQRRRGQVEIREMAPLPRWSALQILLMRRADALGPKPELVIGAGHATHLTLLALKCLWRVPVVVLMKPTLPAACFDLCLVPEHDQPPSRDNLVVTRGALNRMRPGDKVAGSGMMLIGGPSKSNDWDETELIEQLRSIIAQSEGVRWRLTTSRRTPPSTLQQLNALQGVEVIPVEATEPGWLPTQLAGTEQCWVSEDSVSMVYEALSAGCAVGTLTVPWTRQGRLYRGLMSLADQGVISRYQAGRSVELVPPARMFDEAGRCAELILNRGWL